jgi:hypothetical protein
MSTVNGPISSSDNPSGESTTDTSGYLLATKGYTIRVSTSNSPASNGNGDPGEIRWDAGFIYVCTAANTWKRAALTGGY